MENINANVTAEGSVTKEYKFDTEYFLKYLMSYDWDCTAFVVYHPNKEVAANFLRFLGTYFPQIKDRKEAIICDRDQFYNICSNAERGLLNFGQVNYYYWNSNIQRASLNKKIFWVNLLSLEIVSQKHFEDISFWKLFGSVVKEYGKNHF